MYFRSGTGVRCCIGAREMLRFHSPGDSTSLREVNSSRYLKSVTSEQKSDSVNR